MGFLIPGQEPGKTPWGTTKNLPMRGQSEDAGRVLISRGGTERGARSRGNLADSCD
jgi:hypothetical protein